MGVSAFQVGVISFGLGSDCSGEPSGASRVTKMLPFIASIEETQYTIGDKCLQ